MELWSWWRSWAIKASRSKELKQPNTHPGALGASPLVLICRMESTAATGGGGRVNNLTIASSTSRWLFIRGESFWDRAHRGPVFITEHFLTGDWAPCEAVLREEAGGSCYPCSAPSTEPSCRMGLSRWHSVEGRCCSVWLNEYFTERNTCWRKAKPTFCFLLLSFSISFISWWYLFSLCL